MAKVNYDGINFDSDLEVNYYKYLRMENLYFHYHPRVPIRITKNNTYTPDFVVYYPNGVVEIVETKGYNPYSKMKDDMIHQVMLAKPEEELKQWLLENDYSLTRVKTVKYRKIKFLQAYGFVDWDFKNPNTQINKARNKIKTQKEELKELKEFKKNALRYFGYCLKMVTGKKLTKSQAAWHKNYFDEMMKQVQEESKIRIDDEIYEVGSDYKNFKSADTIEDLCDCVVIKRTNTKTNATFYVEYPMEHYQDVKVAMIDNHLDYIKIDYVKFGIWNDDKGLIYVAKFNEKGDLVLI